MDVPYIESRGKRRDRNVPMEFMPIEDMRRRILVVDDDEAVRRALTRLLQEMGNGVEAFPNGIEAQKALDARRFDVAIVDVQLGTGIDGITLALIMGAMQPDLKIILLSGDSFNLKRARTVGFKNVYLKPLLPADIESLRRELAI